MWRGVVFFFFFFFFLFSFFASTCGAVSYLYKTRARGEKMMEDCSFFFFPREALHPASLFFTHRISRSHKQTKNEYVHPRVHRNAQSLQKSGRDHQRGGQGESVGTNFVHGRSRLGVLAHFPRRLFLFLPPKMVKV
jgi:hypothetical protein